MHTLLPALLTSWKILFCLLSFVLTAASASGQTNPAAQTLPYSQDFSSLTHASTTYPAGWQGWDVGTSASSSFRTNAPTANRALTASSSASTNSGGVHNYNGKIGILASGSVDPGLALAISTTGLSGIKVSYDIMTIRNPYDGSTNTRINEATLQYRVGTSGAFTSLTGIEYSNNTTTQTTAVTTPQNTQSKSVTLPAACNNQAVVQLRWVMRDVSGGGSRPSFAVDNISVCPTPVFSLGASPSVCRGVTSTTLSYSATSGFSAPNRYSIDFDAAANTAGFADVPLTALPASPITIAVPGAAAAAVYNATLTIQNACGGSATADFTVTVNALPACSITGPELVCDNTSGITYSAPPGMSNYNWSITSNGSIPGSTTGQSVSVTSGNFIQDYIVSVTITDANGCISTCSKQSFIFYPKPPAAITVNPNPACFGATLDLSIAAASSSTVSWTGEGITNSNGTFTPGDPSSIWNFINSTTAIPTSTGPHIYSVTVTSSAAYGSCSNTGTASVTVYPAPPACSVTGPTSVCANSTGNVYSAPGGVSGYSWSVSGGAIVGSSTGSSVTITAGAGAAYTVSVTLTDANGCTSTCSQPVTVNALPTGSITGPPPFPGPSNDTLCTTIPYVFTGPPGMSAHKWGVSANGSINGSSTGSSVTITPTGFGTLQVRDTITDANGCTSILLYSREIQQAPTCSLNGPLTVCGGSTGNVYTVSSNAGSFGYYVWSISGDGTITSATAGYGLTSATVTAGASGMYTVTVEIKFTFNTCFKSCSETVTINSAAAPTITGPTTVCNGGSVTLDAGPGYATYAWSGGGGSGQTATYNGINSTTTYTVTVTNNGCTGTSSYTVTAQSCQVDFSGKIIFSNNNTLGVNNALVTLAGSAPGSDLTDVNGDFFISTALTSGSFTLKPTKTTLKLNGVTVADAAAIQQHVSLGNPITDLYKQVAADVNKSNSITTVDAAIINQALLGNPSALAQFQTSWRFVPTSHTMTNPPWGFPEQRSYTNVSGPQTNQNFFGIKTGDIVTAFANPANFGAGAPLVLTLNDQRLEAGQELDLPVRAGQLNDLAAFQCALAFDPAQLQLVSVEPAGGLPLSADNFGVYQKDAGEVRIVWAQAQSIDVAEAAPAFRLRLKALQSGAALSEALWLDGNILPALSYNSRLEESAVALQFETSTTGVNDPVGANFRLLPNRPNPFSSETLIGFVLPQACEAQLRVFDTAGRELWRADKTYPAGYNAERLRLDQLIPAGVLYYELITPFGTLTERMLRVK